MISPAKSLLFRTIKHLHFIHASNHACDGGEIWGAEKIFFAWRSLHKHKRNMQMSHSSSTYVRFLLVLVVLREI